MPRLERVEREPRDRPLGIRDVAPERRPSPRRVAAGRLDLHDVGAELGEQHAGEEAGLAGEIEDASAVQGAAHAGARLVAAAARGCQARRILENAFAFARTSFASAPGVRPKWI